MPIALSRFSPFLSDPISPEFPSSSSAHLLICSCVRLVITCAVGLSELHLARSSPWEFSLMVSLMLHGFRSDSRFVLQFLLRSILRRRSVSIYFPFFSFHSMLSSCRSSICFSISALVLSVFRPFSVPCSVIPQHNAGSASQYGIAPGIVFSFPVTVKDGKWTIVQGQLWQFAIFPC